MKIYSSNECKSNKENNKLNDEDIYELREDKPAFRKTIAIISTIILSTLIFFLLTWINGIIQGTLLITIKPEDLVNPGQAGIVVSAIPNLVSFLIYYFGIILSKAIKNLLFRFIVYKRKGEVSAK